ncbi:MAG: FAD-binding protein [Planctomycetes bacterium]|nr:FAD-binding protein [Planctomycetota bacterium]
MAGEYQKVTGQTAAELAAIVGESYVVFNDADRLEPYSHDEIPDRRWAHMPEALVRPGCAEEIAQIMRLANRLMIPVTPRGAGSGLSGGAVPIHGGIVLLFDRMNKIVDIDRGNLTITVEPGVITNEINEVLRDDGLFYAGYPMSLETCTIGGNVAENAGGGKAVKYGVTGRYVIGLHVVTPTGEMVELGGKRVKDVTGYDLIHLLVGSEGTLGIITQITLRLMPLPRASVDLLVLFTSAEDAVAAMPAIMTGGVIPTAVEFMDRASVHAACEYLNETIPYDQAGAMLLITVDGGSEDHVQRDYEAVGEKCLSAGAIEVYVADNHTTSERVWKVRRNIGEAFNLVSRNQSGEDIVVPPASIAKMVAKLLDLSARYGVMIPCFGHAGDGNLHARIVMNPSWTASRWNETLPKMLKELYSLTAELGGRISGEHGIGHKRKAYMPLVVSENYINMLRSIKRSLDPNNVLNPGKIFDL